LRTLEKKNKKNQQPQQQLPMQGGQQQGAQQQQQQQLAQLRPDDFTLETLTHLLVSCPVAAAAWAWFAMVWARVQPGAEVDGSNTRVILLGDRTAWQPPATLQQLWTYGCCCCSQSG
jgi:hypothetical protein